MAGEHGMSEDQEKSAAGWDKLWGLVDDIKTCMMTSVDGAHLRSRPMRGHADQASRQLWFFTKASSHKADEIEQDREVNLAYSRPDKEEYVSLSGRAKLVRDRHRDEAMWNPFVAAWFPKGKDDPDLALVRVDVSQAEYWDSPASRMVQLYEVAKANISGREPDLGENRKL
jgi:general stress protein 26